MKGRTPYFDLKRNTIFEYLDKFPDAPSRQLARMIHENNKALYKDSEEVRTIVRRYRGKLGKRHREIVKLTKYYQDV